MFAGKIHAIICRDYKNHVKGRDYYDYLFYIAKGSKVNLTYLENKLKNSEILHQNEKLTLERVKEMLKEKFGAVDYELAKEDVLNFVDDKSDLNLWKKELFIATLVDLMTDWMVEVVDVLWRKTKINLWKKPKWNIEKTLNTV